MTYEPNWGSVGTHPVPQWYDDAKLGIFLHWGLYSVPGWAPQVDNIQDLLREQGPEGMLRNNPYAEWYRNSMQIEGGPTYEHHRSTYGADFAYDDFVAEFNASSAKADLDALASLTAEAGARYVVLTTKHHEGFTLWPASQPHPRKGHYHAQRDLVGDLSSAVRAKGLHMGLYYSGGYDWPYNEIVMQNPADAALAVPADPAYAEYAAGHVRELIDRYAPSVLWNDICWPPASDLAALFAHYYNSVPEGVINDRWLQPTMHRGEVSDALARGAGSMIQMLWKHIPEDKKHLTFPAAHHYDFETPEYASFSDIRTGKWEATRGVGHSFGANRNERPQDIVTVTELVRSFCDIVSKNGNLLIGIGPMPDGRIPDEQQVPVRGLGAWLRGNGEAIFGSRPWSVAESTTADGVPVRFTQRDGTTYAALLDTPTSSEIVIRGVDLGPGPAVRLLGGGALEVSASGAIRLPDALPEAPAFVLALGQNVRPAS